MRKIILLLLALAGLAGFAPAGSQAIEVRRIEDVIYGRKHGVALTLDVLKPARQSGIGVLFMVSGGWFSSHQAINPALVRKFTDRRQTVFAVVHGSQPKYTIPEILEDVDRATRFARANAARYGVDPGRLGIAGGSAGGHLSLMQGTRGKEGDPKAKDPVQQASSRVQAVGCFFPPTDFINYGKAGQEVVLLEFFAPFRPAFPPIASDPEARRKMQRELSPYYFISKDTAPTLIIHGDADTLVPIQQAERMIEGLKGAWVTCELVIRPGKGHGWPTLADDVDLIAAWFEKHLGGGE